MEWGGGGVGGAEGLAAISSWGTWLINENKGLYTYVCSETLDEACGGVTCMISQPFDPRPATATREPLHVARLLLLRPNSPTDSRPHLPANCPLPAVALLRAMTDVTPPAAACDPDADATVREFIDCMYRTPPPSLPPARPPPRQHALRLLTTAGACRHRVPAQRHQPLPAAD